MRHSVSTSALSIISNTVIIVPFMLFLQLSDGKNIMTLLPFVIFYVFRMTGLFFIRGIRTTLNSQSLLKLSLICGSLGCLLSLLATIYFPLYIFSALFLGLSGAWLPPANTSMKLYLERTNQIQKENIVVSLGLFGVLGYVMLAPYNYRYILSFLIYGLMYGCALLKTNKLSDYEIDSHELEDVSYLYLLLFSIFIILLFFLRSSRLSLNSNEFNYFVIGYLLLTIICMIVIFFFRNKIQRKIPTPLLYLTLINGATGNYLFLFASLYAHGYYGGESVPLQVYLPYVLGMISAPKIKALIQKRLKTNSLLGILFGLLVILITPFFSIGIFITSLFKSTLNSYLTYDYDEASYLPTDKRIWVKYSIQNIGSISHQFFMMFMASLIVKSNGLPEETFFIMTSRKEPTTTSMAIMTSWNHIATVMVILSIVVYLIFALRPVLTRKKG